jgi:hypothetical protein
LLQPKRNIGGVHLNPRSSKNSFARQAGVVVDWAYNSRVALRGEADYSAPRSIPLRKIISRSTLAP